MIPFLLLLPGGLTVYLSFSSGGFYPGATGAAAAALALVLVVRVTADRRPFEGVGPLVAAGACALALLACWTLASSGWSDSESRAVLEFDRVLLYGLAFLLLGTVPRTPERIRLALGGVAVAMLVVCVAGFASRALPDLLPTGLNEANSRLSYPVSYWNGMGLLAALAAAFSVHFASARGPLAVRAVAGAALPLALATLLMTYSRGAIAAGIAALAIYAVVAFGRSLALTVLASLPGSAIAVVATYRADLLAESDYTTPAAVAQGEELALIVAACMLGTALLVVLAAAADRRIPERPPRLGTGARWAVAGVTAAVAVVVAIAAGAPAEIERRYDDFVEGSTLASVDEERDRLTEASNNGRIDSWRVARDAFEAERLRGTGAGTFQLEWARHRDGTLTVSDAHSLPLEVASELGLVGLVLLAAAVGVLLWAFGRGCRGPDRAVHGVLLAAGIAWLLHASIDWDWELPAVTLWLFALGGLASARTHPVGRTWEASRLARVAMGIAALALVVTPARVAVSQSDLNESVRAFRAGDCGSAIDSALSSAKAFPDRPEPFQVLAFCDVRLGRDRLAVRVAEEAVQRDPDNWEFHYSLALVLGATGRDPRASAARALRLNPREELTRRAARAFRGHNRTRWKRVARTAPLPFQAATPSRGSVN